MVLKILIGITIGILLVYTVTAFTMVKFEPNSKLTKIYSKPLCDTIKLTKVVSCKEREIEADFKRDTKTETTLIDFEGVIRSVEKQKVKDSLDIKK